MGVGALAEKQAIVSRFSCIDELAGTGRDAAVESRVAPSDELAGMDLLCSVLFADRHTYMKLLDLRILHRCAILARVSEVTRTSKV